LDAIVNHIAHIEQQRLTLYKGGYSDFERQRAERLAQQQSMYERQQRNVAHLQSYIERFRAKATKARQAQSRIKALERMEMISAAHIDTPFDFSFREMQNVPDPLLVLDDVCVGYGDATILSKIELALRPGERLGLLGRNGAGKSTLIKLLASELAMKSGKRVDGKDLKIGYFAQHQLEQLRLDESPLEHMQKLDPDTREQEHRNYLGGFDFKGDMASSPCGPFSGGEKSRLALALLIWTRPNLLLLDEPTNHLDLEMRHALTVALQEYQGGVVIVSHDRAMLRATCDKFMLVAQGKAEVFDGDLDDYKDWLNAQKLADKQSLESSKEVPVSSNKVERAQSKAYRQARIAERRPLLKETEQIEANMAKWEQDKTALDNKLADPDLYTQSDKSILQDLLKRQAELVQQLETVEMRWLELQEMLEALPAFQ
jgi:ATP-binding cassette subfamily F protein 3